MSVVRADLFRKSNTIAVTLSREVLDTARMER